MLFKHAAQGDERSVHEPILELSAAKYNDGLSGAYCIGGGVI